MRRQLIEALRERGISDERVLEVMGTIPRHYFLDKAFEEWAYQDKPFPIGAGQTISQPYTVAYQTQLLQVKPFDKILEIGTGSMYQASILAELGAQVFTIERQHALFDKTREFIYRAKYPSVKFFFLDGFEGLPQFAPFDKVLVTAAAPYVPEKLLTQLKTGGIMVVPVDAGEVQRMLRIIRQPDGTYKEDVFDNFSFVPMLSGKQR